MINSVYLIHLVKTYFSTVFFVWVLGNILLRLLVTKKRKKKRKKRKKKRKKTGGGIEIIWLPIYNFVCFLLELFSFGMYACLPWEEPGVVRVGHDQLESV